METVNLDRLAKALDREADRLNETAERLREQAASLRSAHAVTAPLLAAVEAAMSASKAGA